MKISKKEVNLLLGLLGVIIAICGYYFGFIKINEKTEALVSQNNIMESDIRKYESWLDDQEFYVSQTDSMHGKIS